MRRLSLAILLASSTAAADPVKDVDDALAKSTLAKLFAKEVGVKGIAFATEPCQKAFGHAMKVSGADLGQLAECVQIGFHVWGNQLHANKVALASYDNAVLEVELSGASIVAIGSYGADAKDADLPTFATPISKPEFVPSAATKAAIDKTTSRRARALIKLCHDAAGKVTSKRLVDASGVAGFDDEALKSYDQKTLVAAMLAGKAIAACQLGEVTYAAPKDLVQPIKIEKIESATPPPSPPKIVSPTLLEPLRIAGTKLITPDDKTKSAIAASGKIQVVASLKLCLDDKGTVSVVKLLRSSGFAAYDQHLDREIHTWKYKPFIDGGVAIPVCSAVTFVYSQR